MPNLKNLAIIGATQTLSTCSSQEIEKCFTGLDYVILEKIDETKQEIEKLKTEMINNKFYDLKYPENKYRDVKILQKSSPIPQNFNTKRKKRR